MSNIIIIEREHIPVERIAYIAPFEAPASGQFRPDKPYKGRVVLLNRETVLTEERCCRQPMCSSGQAVKARSSAAIALSAPRTAWV